MNLLVLLTTANAGVNGEILFPAHADLLRATDPAYDVASESLSIAALLGGAPNVHVNGHPVVAPGLLVIDDVAMGTGAPWWATTGQWPAWIYQRDRFQFATRMLLPILGESFDAQGQLVSRDRVVVIDARADEQMAWRSDLSLQSDTVGARLTPSGVAVFERTHSAMLPLPGLEVYNDRLDALAAGLTGDEHAVSGCAPLTAHPDFKTLDAWTRVQSTAVAARAVYESTRAAADAARASGNFILAASLDEAADAMCVQDPVIDDHFEVCVATAEIDPTGMTAGAFDWASLTLDEPFADLASDLQLSDLDATFQVTLRDVDLRWSEGAVGCIGLPTERVDEADFATEAWLRDWSTCDDQHLDAAIATTGAPNRFDLIVSPVSAERLEVIQVDDGWTYLAGTTTRQSETCQEPFLRGDVAGLLLGEASRLGLLPGDAWNHATPDTEQAEALTMLFSGFDVGARRSATTTPERPYRSVATSSLRGVALRWDSATVPRFGAPFLFGQSRWMHDVALGTPTTVDGLTPLGAPYDLSLRLTADAINQHLQAAGVDDALVADLTPTWNDFGVRPPTGVSGTSPMPLTGANLARWAPPLIGLGPNLRLTVQPTMSPFLWIPQDNFGRPLGQQPVLLSLGQVLVRLIVPDPGGDPAHDRIAFSAAVDIYDTDLQLLLDVGPSTSTTLRARAGDMRTTATLIENDLALCPYGPHIDLASYLYRCERQLEQRIVDDLGPLLEGRLLSLFRSFHLPRYFDAQGASPDPAVVVGEVERFVTNGELTVYLNLR